MNKQQRYDRLRAKGKTLEGLAARQGWPYPEVCRVMRTGHFGAPGTRTHLYARAIARALGLTMAEAWGDGKRQDEAA